MDLVKIDSHLNFQPIKVNRKRLFGFLKSYRTILQHLIEIEICFNTRLVIKVKV